MNRALRVLASRSLCASCSKTSNREVWKQIIRNPVAAPYCVSTFTSSARSFGSSTCLGGSWEHGPCRSYCSSSETSETEAKLAISSNAASQFTKPSADSRERDARAKNLPFLAKIRHDIMFAPRLETSHLANEQVVTTQDFFEAISEPSEAQHMINALSQEEMGRMEHEVDISLHRLLDELQGWQLKVTPEMVSELSTDNLDDDSMISEDDHEKAEAFSERASSLVEMMEAIAQRKIKENLVEPALEWFDRLVVLETEVFGDKSIELYTRLRAAGVFATEKRKFQSAFSYLEQAHEISLNLNEPGMILEVLNELGLAYGHSGQVDKSVETFRSIMEIVSLSTAEERLSHRLVTVDNIRTVYLINHEYGKARDIMDDELEFVAVNHGDRSPEFCDALLFFGNTCAGDAQWDEALVLLRASAELSKELYTEESEQHAMCRFGLQLVLKRFTALEAEAGDIDTTFRKLKPILMEGIKKELAVQNMLPDDISLQTSDGNMPMVPE